MENSKDNKIILSELVNMMESLDSIVNKFSKLEKIVDRIPAAPPFKMAGGPSNIILFPGTHQSPPSNTEFGNFKDKQSPVEPVLAYPGTPFPSHLTDFRPYLQRDGLILLSWDKRFTEKGDLYTAYWVTSMDVPRFYASKMLPFKDFSTARPDHKSYAAEDGIEFYGQKAPDLIVHVAPDLMKSNPRHRDYRAAYIEILTDLGSKVNFNHKYLLKTDKKRNLAAKKPSDEVKNQAGLNYNFPIFGIMFFKRDVTLAAFSLKTFKTASQVTGSSSLFQQS